MKPSQTAPVLDAVRAGLAMAKNGTKTVEYFRLRAKELLTRADTTSSPRARQIYIELAASWFELAQRTEQLEKGEE